MSGVPAWKTIFVNADFLETVHGSMACEDCHAGNPKSFTLEGAHEGLIALPSENAVASCGGCHADVTEKFATSLHYNQEGYFHWFEERAGYDLASDAHKLQEFGAECGSCHTSCGDCHIGRPKSNGGGLGNGGHLFQGTPSMTDNCTACHGSRVGEEYTGAHTSQGIKADVHYIPNAKRCEFCHSGAEMHGDGNIYVDRYDADMVHAVKCEDCHESARNANFYHTVHWAGGESSGNKLQCQVCHSQSYKNCNGCHVGGDGITGSSYLTFEIGRNYMKSERHDFDYMVVRHIPIAPDTYAEWGESDLANYTAHPTWKLATPHNIQRWTEQTTVEEGESCGSSCHDSDIYLRESDIELYNASGYEELERIANQPVFMD
ncbi:MAG: hypothetical protein D6675_04265 [Gemmatimonadetes bacterium]|nr:MAG: hypothetical protein D6675_04265 [Gemmatimonadota bacterium]